MRGLDILAAAALLFAAPAVAQNVDLDLALAERSLGDDSAPVTIIAYESFSCGHCATFHRETYNDLKSLYIDTGKVRFIFRDYPLNPAARLASMVARCVDPERFFGLAAVIFQSQDIWLNAANPVFHLGRIGRLAGMDTERMETCVNNTALGEGIDALKTGGELEFGVSTTPSFVVNGELYEGRQTIDQFAAILDPLLEDVN